MTNILIILNFLCPVCKLETKHVLTESNEYVCLLCRAEGRDTPPWKPVYSEDVPP